MSELIGHVLYALPLKAWKRLLVHLSACLRAWTDGCALSGASLSFLESSKQTPSTDGSLYRQVDCLSKTGKSTISTLIYTVFHHRGRPLTQREIQAMPMPAHRLQAFPSLEPQTSLAQIQNQPRIDHLQSHPPPISSSHAEYRSAHSCRANRQPHGRRKTSRRQQVPRCPPTRFD